MLFPDPKFQLNKAMDQNSTLKLHIPILLEHIFLLTCITLKIEENQTFYIFDRKIAPKNVG